MDKKLFDQLMDIANQTVELSLQSEGDNLIKASNIHRQLSAILIEELSK